MKIRPVEAELFHADRWTDGRTDMTMITIAFRNFLKAPNQIEYLYNVFRKFFFDRIRNPLLYFLQETMTKSND